MLHIVIVSQEPFGRLSIYSSKQNIRMLSEIVAVTICQKV